MAPIIAITTYGRHEQPLKTDHYDQFFVTPAHYADCVQRAGGIPLLLPPQPVPMTSLLDRIDGMIFSGGADIDPRLYGGDPDHPALTRMDRPRDDAEIAAMGQILDHGALPVLCICRGLQVLNVALGGTLTEHVPDLGNGDMHRADDGLWCLHDVEVMRGSQTAKAMDAHVVNTMSGHHQALKTVAPGLTVTATAADGVVEACEVADHPWLVAVQWHPELTAATDPTQQGLFDTLVEEAGK